MKKAGLIVLKLAVAAAIASCVSLGSATAQSLKASFTLPYEVQWGKALLPAGSYTITFDGRQGPAIISTEAGQNRAIVMPVTTSRAMSNQPSALLLAAIEGGYDVLYLNVPEANVSFGFRIGKNVPRPVASNVVEPDAVAIAAGK